jgi:hypothetical protein
MGSLWTAARLKAMIIFGEHFAHPNGGSMTLCPIALMATCNKCPAVGICPLKEVLGDYKPADHVDDAKSVSQKEESKN